jgi:hypothetical protein
MPDGSPENDCHRHPLSISSYGKQVYFFFQKSFSLFSHLRLILSVRKLEEEERKKERKKERKIDR